MKNRAMVLSAFFIMVLFGLVGFGCGSAGSGGGSSTFFFTKIAATAPVFTPSSTNSRGITAQSTTEWGSGNPLYAVYFSLREFLSSRDEGVVDRSNIYKLLVDLDTVYSGASAEALPITEQVITPPFAGLGVVTCDAAVNDVSGKKAIALKATANRIKAVLGWIWTDSPAKEEYGVAVLDYNTNTQDIIADMTYSVDYDLNSTVIDYYIRGQVSGNVSQHSFAFKYIIGDCQLVAKGVSRGEGNYMLFKYKGWGADVKYIVVPGTADEDYFIAQNSNPTNIYTNPDDLPATVAGYKDWVVDTGFLATTDAVTDLTQFNLGNPKAGTIYINYL